VSPRLVLIGGGVRSGKSSFALSRARLLGGRLAFIATAQAYDEEMRSRIVAHRVERGEAFTTFESPLALPETISALRGYDAVVVDCLTLWLSNLLMEAPHAELHRGAVESLAGAILSATCPVIVVSNEVGMGIVPDNPLSRAFRDLAGFAHQRLSREADEIYVAVMGTVLRLRPSPVEAMVAS
jgi:adenosylcobinamide kinase/adenosylcobinamide-phosphate guanylyltransferase